MKESRHQPDETSSTANTRLTISRILLWAVAVSAILALAFIVALHSRPDFTANTSDPYAALPFRPGVTYDSLDVTIINTEEEPYLDTRLNLYVGAIVYSVKLGTMHPGEKIIRSLRTFTNEHGESFDPATHKAILLEVRARFGGYDVHKDFPPPQ
jgi:hypothetical protein